MLLHNNAAIVLDPADNAVRRKGDDVGALALLLWWCLHLRHDQTFLRHLHALDDADLGAQAHRAGADFDPRRHWQI